MRTVQLTLIGKPGCHLCDEAREAIEAVRAAEGGVPTELVELDILQDAALAAKYAEEIPVVLVNGRKHSFWRVDQTRLTTAIRKAGTKKWPFATSSIGS